MKKPQFHELGVFSSTFKLIFTFEAGLFEKDLDRGNSSPVFRGRSSPDRLGDPVNIGAVTGVGCVHHGGVTGGRLYKGWRHLRASSDRWFPHDELGQIERIPEVRDSTNFQKSRFFGSSRSLCMPLSTYSLMERL